MEILKKKQLQFSWNKEQGSILLFSSVLLMRNIEGPLFPPLLDSAHQEQVRSLLKERLSLVGNKLNTDFLFFSLRDMSPAERGYLLEQLFIPFDILGSETKEAVALHPEIPLMVFINIENHLHFFFVDPEKSLENLWKELSHYERNLGELVPYAFSQKFGFLTRKPKDAGCGTKVSSFLHIPAIIAKENVKKILEELSEEAFILRPVFGLDNEGKPIGSVVAVENIYNLGVTEENLLRWEKRVVNSLIEKELSYRQKIIQENDEEVKDVISRAFAILKHSYKMDPIEVLNALSWIKLGITLNWIDGIEIETLNQLMIQSRQHHLSVHFKKEINTEELPHLRADFLHEALKTGSLAIK